MFGHVNVSVHALVQGACRGCRLFGTTSRMAAERVCNSSWSSSSAQLNIQWDDAAGCSVDGLWLRDHCMCSSCRHPTSFHRNVDTFKLTREQHSISSTELSDDDLCVTWSDGHQSRFPSQWLRVHCLNASSTNGKHHVTAPEQLPRRSWTAPQLDPELARVPYESFQRRDGLRAALGGLWRHGLALLYDVPCNEAATLAVSERLGGVARTVYEDLWRTEPVGGGTELDDEAYSRAALGLHTDGSFATHVPAVQVFHSYVAGCGGEGAAAENGVSTFADGLRAAEELARRAPESLAYLSATPLAYQFYTRNAHRREHMVHSAAAHPVFRFDERGSGDFLQICHNNHHRAAQLSSSASELYRHLRVLNDVLYEPGSVFKVLLEPGMVALVDNYRVLHGRTAFAGNRLLAGCYVSVDQYHCSLRENLMSPDVRLVC